MSAEELTRVERVEDDLSKVGLVVAEGVRAVEIAAIVLLALLVCSPLMILAVIVLVPALAMLAVVALAAAVIGLPVVAVRRLRRHRTA
jgi:uncharacterized membrane protein